MSTDALDPLVLAPKKPLLRGVFHLGAFFVALAAGAVLLALAPSFEARWGGGVFVASLALSFGVSALYHLFHAFTIAASACHFVAISRITGVLAS
jgi:predicted membrane channel-forming protein YqfA (hemolysin III family)